jgi:hypothetical protein
MRGCKYPPDGKAGLCGFHTELVEIARSNIEAAKKLLPKKKHCPWCIKCRAVMEAYSYRPGYLNFDCPNQCKFRKPAKKKVLAQVIPIRSSERTA